jgi:hypothetical protein
MRKLGPGAGTAVGFPKAPAGILSFPGETVCFPPKKAGTFFPRPIPWKDQRLVVLGSAPLSPRLDGDLKILDPLHFFEKCRWQGDASVDRGVFFQ